MRAAIALTAFLVACTGGGADDGNPGGGDDDVVSDDDGGGGGGGDDDGGGGGDDDGDDDIDEQPGGGGDDEPPLPEGCDALVTPMPGSTPVASELRSAPWYRCGAYGSGGARIVRVSDDSSAVALVTDAGEATVLSLPDLSERGAFAHGRGRVSFAGLSSDGARLATVHDEAGEVALWDVASGALVRVMARDPAPLSYYDLGDVAFSPDDAQVTAVSSAGVHAYDVATGVAAPFAWDPLFPVSRVRYAAGGARVVLGVHSWFGNGPYAGWGSVAIVDATTGANRVDLDYDFHIQMPAIAVSGDGNVIAVGTSYGDLDIALYDPTGARLPVAPIQGVPLALSADGSRIAVTAAPDAAAGAIEIRTVGDGALVTSIAIDTRRPIAVAPDLAHALIGDDAPDVLTARSLEDVTTGVACGNGGGDQFPGDLSQTSDGAVLAVASADGSSPPIAWDVATGAAVDAPPAESLVGPSAISPDGRYEARASADPSSPDFELVDRETGAVVRTFGPHPTRVIGLEFSPDGALIASSSEREPVDRRAPAYVKLWDAATGALVQDVETDAERTALFHTSGARLFVPTAGTTAVWCTASP